MQINQVHNSFAFCRALPTSKKEDYRKTAHEAKKALGIDDGLSILKIHAASMPKQDIFDTGMGKLNSKPALDFIDKMTFYTDTNAIKEFPAGSTPKLTTPYFCPYAKSATTFGEDNINLLNIVQDKSQYGDILNMSDIETLRSKSKKKQIDYGQELALGENYPILEPLRTAYKNFKKGFSTIELEEEFEEFKKTKRAKESYPRLALYSLIAKKDPNLFRNFDNSPIKQKRFEFYRKIYADEIEFFQFRQFLAKKEHEEAKQKINQKEIKLFGDCLIGFSDMEVWAYPEAFEEGACVGLYEWGLPALQFDDILDENSKAHRLFDDKVSFFLENYDGIRFDVGWCYAISQAGREGQNPKDTHRVDFGHRLYDFIEKRARDIKGSDFDTRNLIYEMDVGGDAPAMFDWSGEKPKPIENIKGNMNVLTTEWEHNQGLGWGSPEFFKNIMGMEEDELIMGTNNHDGATLKHLATSNKKENIEKRTNNAHVLSELFNIPCDTLVNNPREFAKAKFAQLYTIKNQFLFFVDVLGSKFDMDDQTMNHQNYSFRVNKNFESQYHTALQDGYGFNLMESLKLSMEQKGLNKTNPELYEKVSYYADFLRQKGAKTEKQANTEEKRQKKNFVA